MAEAVPKLSGDTAKRYRILKTLGAGGMGEVFHGQHIELGRDVAIKRLKEEVALDKSVVKRFVNEARAVNLIRHENIVEVTDFFTDDKGRVHMVMELLEGRSLGALIRSMAPLPYQRVAHIGVQIAEALAAAHKSGIIHRDLKPENVFLIRRKSTQDYVKLLDFGIARLHPRCGGLEATESGVVMGTPVYMSPEQAKGAEVDAGADTYSLGIILYEMLAGRGPFPKTSAVEMMMAHISEEPQPFQSEGLPDEFKSLIESCLAKDSKDRPKSMTAIAEILEPMAVATQESDPMGLASESEDISSAPTWDHSEPPVASLQERSACFAKLPESGSTSRSKRNIAILAGAVLALGTSLFLLTRGSSSEPDKVVEPAAGRVPTLAPDSIRSQVDKEMASMGFSPTPLGCKASEQDVLATHLRAVKLLSGGGLGQNTPKDQLAWNELSTLTDDLGPETSFWKARARLQQGKIEEARRYASQAIQACPKLASAYAIAGTACALEGNHADAIVQLKLALTVDPHYHDARFNLALSQLSAKDILGAIESLSELLEAKPRYEGALYLRGRSYLQMHKPALSEADLNLAVETVPDNVAAWYLLGFARRDMGKLVEAKAAFCRAHELGHKSAPCDEDSTQGINRVDTESWQSDPFESF